MNRVAAIASAVASLALADAGHAESFAMNSPAGIENTLRTFNGTNFDVKHISGDTDGIASGSLSEERGPRDVHMIRAAIASNARLAHRLSEQGVRVQNVINADQAADGSIVFYYR